MGFWDVFYNSTLLVQAMMLLAALSAFAVPGYVMVRFIKASRADYLPPDTLFHIRRSKDVLHFSLHRHVPLTHEQALNLLADLSAMKNGPTDNQ